MAQRPPTVPGLGTYLLIVFVAMTTASLTLLVIVSIMQPPRQ
jgi:hypothetical protein